MLNKKYRYVSVDCETTGLDSSRDSIIQIWLVELDELGNILGRFQSLVCPDTHIKDLKNIVQYITGISFADVESAPSFASIADQVRNFLGDDVVLIGHNIQFDISFLRRYIIDFCYARAVDTFPLAQSLVHFAPSYALEVLVSYLQHKDKDFVSWFEKLHDDVEAISFHDALHDALHAASLFLYCMERIYILCKKYPYMVGIYNSLQVDVDFSNLLNLEHFSSGPIHIQALEKSIPQQISMSTTSSSLPLDEYRQWLTLDISALSLQECMQRICSNKKIIVSFSHKQKLDLAKKILEDLSVQGVWYLSQTQRIDMVRLTRFFQKGAFDVSEFLFALRYVSQMDRGMWFLDLHSVEDYRIYFFVKDEAPTQPQQSVILTTHGGLLSYMKRHPDALASYTVCFMDSDWWYKSYNNYASERINPYDFLQLLDTIVYSYKLCVELYDENIYRPKYELLLAFRTFVSLFVGVLFIDSKKIFTNTQHVSIQVDPLSHHWWFYYTRLLRNKLLAWMENLRVVIPDYMYDLISEWVDGFAIIIDSVVWIHKVMYSQSWFYFVYVAAGNFVQWQEFMMQFATKKVLFLSPMSKAGNLSIVPIAPTQVPNVTVVSQKNILIDLCYREVQQGKLIFVLSTNKQVSQDLFTSLLGDNLLLSHQIIGENITGGYGKLLYQLSRMQQWVVIWGYSFLLSCYSKNISIDKICVFHIVWGNRGLLLTDVYWYGTHMAKA
jgi:DNA polymerase III epsilon subunit-like protein